MISIPPSPELAALLEAFDARGGVIELEFYEADTSALDQLQHREAARQFLRKAAAAFEQHKQYLKSIGHEPVWKSQLKYLWDESQLTGRSISFAEFWGSELPDSGFRIPDGFQTAFFLTPYGLSGGVAANQQLFEDICQHLFPADMRAGLTIYTWNTDCSDAFKAGREWWGTFFWTVSRPGDKVICVIAASTTD